MRLNLDHKAPKPSDHNLRSNQFKEDTKLTELINKFGHNQIDKRICCMQPETQNLTEKIQIFRWPKCYCYIRGYFPNDQS